MAVTLSSLSLALAQMPASTGFDFSILAKGSAATPVFNGGSVKVAITNAEKNEARQLAQVAKDPVVQKDIARYAKVVKSAKTIDDVLNDPVARRVLMTANGLGAYVDSVALAKKAMLSDPADPNSLAARLQATEGAWLQFAQDYDILKNGLDRLSPRMDGFAGKWRITLEREGEPVEALLELGKTVTGVWTAKIDGDIVPVTVEGGSITLNLLWEDADEHLHTTKLTGTLAGDGLSVSGPQVDDGQPSTSTWGAIPWYANSVKDVSDNYVAEKRLDMLDQQMPGLGTAILFKQIAGTLDTPVKILGSALGREVVTTALGLPKQLALQSLAAQQKAITQRMDPAKLKNEHFADQIAQRYLIMLNGGAGGITV
jgi:hypothetical protein